MRNWVLGTALLLTPIAYGTAQTSRWNDRTTERWTEEAPAVRLWFDGNTQLLRFGSVARVRFETDEDAYVIVGRVDSDGRMSILFPYNRTQRPFVRGGVSNIVRSRRGGSSYSFVSTERWGMGFVFAVASYEPMDVSRFQNRDFESYDGVMNAMARRYSGNPQRIVERFAPWVLYDRDTPYDYDILNYSVESPTFASYSSYCGAGYSGLGYDGMYDPSFCSHALGYYGFVCSGFWGYGSALCYDPIWGRIIRQGPIFAGGNPPPTSPGQPTPGDKVPNTKLIPQVGNPNDPGTKQGGGQKALELPTRPAVGGTAGDDELNRVYSIPRRALDDLRRQERIERRPVGEIAVDGANGAGPRPAPRDRGREAGGNDDGGRPLGGPARRDWGRDRDNPTTRADNTPRYEPPPREAPRNFDPPSRGTSGGGSFERGGGERNAPPPRSFDPGPRMGDGGGRASSGGGADGGGARPAPAPHPAPPVREPASSGEKKPEKH
ncbi:MAG: DUF4384 domain-containing protein [Gemmatimonadaceae bacterium]